MIDALMFAKEAAAPDRPAGPPARARRQAQARPRRARRRPGVPRRRHGRRRGRLRTAFAIVGKPSAATRSTSPPRRVTAKFLAEHPTRGAEIVGALGKLEKKIVRSRVITEGKRIDGRGTRDIRPIYIEAHPLARPHGSALFQRGETQAIVTTTLGTEHRRPAPRHPRRRPPQLLLHYNFPPFCTGEAKPLRGQAAARSATAPRRARAARHAHAREVPVHRSASSARSLESNGSSSMAAVCGGCLASWTRACRSRRRSPASPWASSGGQRDRGPLRHPRRRGPPRRHGLQGLRHPKGITALQMDIKVEGLTREILEKALEQAREGRLHILGKMLETLPEPRNDISKYAPRITSPCRSSPTRSATSSAPAARRSARSSSRPAAPSTSRTTAAWHRLRRPGRIAKAQSTSSRASPPRPRSAPSTRRRQAHRRLRRLRRDPPGHRRPHPHLGARRPSRRARHRCGAGGRPLLIRRLHPEAVLPPRRMSEGAAGLDLAACLPGGPVRPLRVNGV
jgi:hypothetical protein